MHKGQGSPRSMQVKTTSIAKRTKCCTTHLKLKTNITHKLIIQPKYYSIEFNYLTRHEKPHH